jgi:hypothetical protein
VSMTNLLNRKLMPIALTVLGFVCAANAADRFSTFKSENYGYVVQYPHSWYLDSTLDNLEIENFPPSKAVRGVRLPPGGPQLRSSLRKPFINPRVHKNSIPGSRRIIAATTSPAGVS